jgi:tRNA(Ile)-lysidine synthase
MPLPFEQKVLDFIGKNALIPSGSRVLLAVSGGADSTALLRVLSSLKSSGSLDAALYCAHVNHGLRGAESDADEAFVVRQAAELGLPVTARSLDVRRFAAENKLSIETAGRRMRIDCLADIARAAGIRLAATAHQKNDNAETLVHRLSRGTGLRGLCGIWPKKSFESGLTFIRPLLAVTRAEIERYLMGNNTAWRVDSTNADCSHTRNFIRHRLIPAVEARSGGALVEPLCRLSEQARRLCEAVSGAADRAWAEAADCRGPAVALSLPKLSDLHPEVKVELVRRSLSRVGCGEGGLDRLHYDRILELAEKNVGGRQVQLPGGFAAERRRSRIILYRRCP